MNYPEIGQRIKEAREANGLTQEKLAELADISVTHMSVIERGVKSPRVNTLVNIMNALGVSADYIFQDVVNYSTQSTTNELYERIRHLPATKQQKIFSMIRLMIEE